MPPAGSDGLILVVGLALLIAGLLVMATARRSRLRNVVGNVVVGDVRGSVTQTYKGGPPPFSSSGIGVKEVIGWALMLPGTVLSVIALWKLLDG